MNKIKSILFLSLLVLVFYNSELVSQESADFKIVPISLEQYILNVAKGNLSYIAGQFSVNIAEAELQASKVFPDPEISVAYTNNEESKLQMGQSFETGISYPLNTGNRRKAGIEFNVTQLELSILLLESYFRNLRADAAKSYYTALKNNKISQLQEETYSQLKNLARADSIRLRSGEATEIDAVQTALEAKLQLHNVLQSKAEMQNSLVSLLALQGRIIKDTLYSPGGDFPLAENEFLLTELINNALESQTDIMIAAKNRELSERSLRLLKADRAFEFSLEAGYSYNSVVKNEIAPAPAHNSVSAGISIPLKFSGINKGSINAAEFAITRNNLNYREIELQIISDVSQAYNIYVASREKVRAFNKGLIEDAEKILQARIHAYQSGESGLVDVLNARRMYTEMRTSYIESLYEFTAALIDLERAAGMWDLTN